MIAGVVLAAGRSSRMGAPKALLTLAGETFLERIIRSMRAGGCESIVVVTGPPEAGATERIAEIARESGAFVTVNPDSRSAQIESLRVALRFLAETPEATVVTPVDAPGASDRLMHSLIAAVGAGAAIAVPSFDGRQGHPVVFGHEVIPELLEGDLPEGARTVIRRYRDRVVHIEADDRRVLLDVDTPAEYARLRETL